MATALRRRMTQDLQVAGLSGRTQEAYPRAVRMLADHFHTPPDRLSEAQVRDYFLHLKNDRHFAADSLAIAYAGIKFFYSHTAPRDWPTLRRLRVPGRHASPTSSPSTRSAASSPPSARPTTAPISGPSTRWASASARASTSRSATSTRARMMVHVRHGKGARTASSRSPRAR